MKHLIASRSFPGLALAAVLVALEPFAGAARAAEEPEDPSTILPPQLTLPDDATEPSPRGEAGPSTGRGKPDARSAPNEGENQPGKAPSTVEQRDKLLIELYARLAAAPDAEQASPVVTAIEQLWTYSGSPTADLLAARGLALAQSGQHDVALELLTAAVELQPDYAEAWNRRAYIYYLQNDTARALGDLRRVLALEPNHFKALEGLASILQNAGEKESALKAYESLLKIYPAMPGAKKSRDDLSQELRGQGI